MKKRNILFVVAVVSMIAICSCATIISGTWQTLTVNSNVTGAEVTLNGQRLGVTPYVGQVKRQSGTATLRVSHPEYQEQVIGLQSSINGVFWVNILSGGLYGSTTDAVSGAMYQYSPNTYYAQLQPRHGIIGSLDEMNIRKYAMINHSQVAIDANNEDGEYLLALADLMGSKMEKEIAVETIKSALEVAHGDQLTFGDELIKSFQGYN